MITRFAVLGGDLRQSWLARMLLSDGFSVSCIGVPELSDTKDALADAQAIVLPLPSFSPAGQIRCQTGEELRLQDVLDALRPGSCLFGGGLDAQARLLAQYPVRVFDLLRMESMTVANAVPTAEGAIQIAMERLPITLYKSRCLVVGFGRIGKLLARRLQALGAHVTVCARKPGDLALAEACGYGAGVTGKTALESFDCVFNTVPAPVFSATALAGLQPDSLFIDLASGSGGLALEARESAPPQYIHALALPGRVAPKTAAAIIHRAIFDTLAAEQESVWNP